MCLVTLLYVSNWWVVLLACVSLAFGDHDVTGLFFSRVCVGFVLGRSVRKPFFAPLFSRVANPQILNAKYGFEYMVC
jgi:hypothetical protein